MIIIGAPWCLLLLLLIGTLASRIDPCNLPLNHRISAISVSAQHRHIDGLETGACLRGQRRAREGWKSVRRCDDPSRRLLNGLTRASRHCAVAAASSDPGALTLQLESSSWTCSRPWCARRTAAVPGGVDGRLVARCHSPVSILEGPPLAPLS